MTVRAVRKEMDMGQNPSVNQAPPQAQEIPDHTHPEYDQMMVKLQEIEGEMQKQAPGGINQEPLPDAQDKYPKEEDEMKKMPKMESYIRKLIREELTGMPEREIGKDKKSAGPDNTQDIPQTDQPANPVAPSGGGFDSDDKTNKEDGDSTSAKTSKPKEFEKMPIKKNKLERAKFLIERAKKLMREANEPDPTQPNPGKTEENPKQMDGQTGNKSPMGGTESATDGMSEDPEGNIPNKKRPLLKEEDGNDIVTDEEEDRLEEKTVNSIYDRLKKEIANETKSNRKSFVGLTARTSERTMQNQEEFLNTKQRVTNSVKEYLSKAGHSRALGYMVPPSTY
jgi:hypothetical protein